MQIFFFEEDSIGEQGVFGHFNERPLGPNFAQRRDRLVLVDIGQSPAAIDASISDAWFQR